MFFDQLFPSLQIRRVNAALRMPASPVVFTAAAASYVLIPQLRRSPEMTLVCSRGITHALGELVNGRVARVNERIAAQSRFDCAACSSSRRSRASL